MKLDQINTVAIVGAGMMGHGIAQVFATAGYEVILQSRKKETLDKALTGIESNFKFLMENDLIKQDEIERAMQKIETTQDLEEAAEKAQFIVESVAEDMDVKQEVFKKLDASSHEDTILATNTSVMSVTEIASKSEKRQRIIGTHFWNPPYLIPLVEVVRAEDSSDEAMDVTMELLTSVGKHPVYVKKDVPGFVANRLQHALWREAISIVENGIADAKTVDECIKTGFGLRLPVLAPLENADLVGLDLTYAIHNYILRHLDSSPEPSKILIEKMNKNELGVKSGKGFYDWPGDKGEQLKKNMLGYLSKYYKKP